MFGYFLKRSAPRLPPVVFQYWDSNPPPDISLWMRSWRDVEPRFRLQQFDNASAHRFIESRIGSAAANAYRTCKPPAMKADIFRYCALYAMGGVYVDAGTEYRGGLESLYRLGRRGLLLQRSKGGPGKLINGFMIARAAGDPLIEWVLQTAIRNVELRTSQNVWAVTGPAILRSAYSAAQPAGLFSGFAILEMHSKTVRRVVQFRRRSDKLGLLDWRRMRDEERTIFDETEFRK